jgi:hypothetical protein
MSKLFFLLVVLAGTGWAAAEPSMKHLAILDFEGSESVHKDQLSAITDRLQAEVLATNTFQLLDRSQTDVILSEQGFQQAGACNSSECQVQVGQMLGVDKILTGKVVAFGDIWAISLRYLDVQTGKVEKVFSFEVKGELIDVLRTGCHEGAMQLQAYARPTSISATSSAPTTSPAAKKWKLPTVVGLGLLGAGAVAGGFWAHAQASDERDAYSSLSSTERADYDAQWQKVDDKLALRNTLWGAGAVLLAAGLTIQFVF